MNEPLTCLSRTHGIRRGDVIAFQCKDCSRLASGRTIRVHIYHRWRLTPVQLMPLKDLEVLAGTPFDEIDVTDNTD